MASAVSLENEAIRTHLSDLVKQVQKSLITIVGEAHAGQLITDDQKAKIGVQRTEKEKAQKFMDFIIENVQDRESFEKFCELLTHQGSIPSQRQLAQKLKEFVKINRKHKKDPRVKEDSPGDDSDGDGKPEDDNHNDGSGGNLHQQGTASQTFDSGYSQTYSQGQDISQSSDSVEEGAIGAGRSGDYPYLDTKKMSKDQRTQLEISLTVKQKEIMTMFADLDFNTCQSLKEGIDPKELAYCVLTLSPFRAGIGKKPLLDEHKTRIENAHTVYDIFLCARDYWSFYNYNILKHIIKHCGSKTDKEDLKKYEVQFKIFCQRSIREVPESVYCGNERNDEKRSKLAVKLSEGSGITTVEDVFQAQIAFEEILGLNPSALHLCTIKQGCIELVFLVPEFVTRTVFEHDFSDEQKANLSLLSIVKVECNQPPVFWQAPEYEFKPLSSKNQTGEPAQGASAKNESATHSKNYSTGISSIHMEEGDSEDSEDSELDESDEEPSDSSSGSLSDSQADSESDQEFEMEHSPTISLEPKYQSDSSSVARKRNSPADFSQSFTKRIKCEDKNIPLSPEQSGIDIKPEEMAEVTKNVVCAVPPEVLALILCRLPPQDLLSCRRVSKMWNDTIEKYLPWKKRYLLCKTGEAQAKRQVLDVAREIFSEEEFIFGIARCIPKYFEKVEQKRIVLNTLNKQPQFLFAKYVMGKRAEEDLCGAIPLMVIGSRHVSEVHSLISGLMTSLHPDSRPEVTELFYCLATLFFALWNMGILPQRFHYYVFFSMSILESGSYPDYASFEDLQTTVGTTMPSASVSTPSRVPSQKQFTTPRAVASYVPKTSGSKPPSKRPQASIGTRPTHKMSQRRGKKMEKPINPTTEQLRILKHPLKRGEAVRISALAGTGKTTTLMMVAQKNLQWKFLYCAFNKSAKRHAETKFPRNVDVTTMHSLAYRKLHVQTKFSGKLAHHGINALDVAGYLSQEKAPKFGYPELYGHAKNVLATLNAFIASDNDTIMEIHLQTGAGKQEILADATDLWKKMSDPDNKSVKFTHDGYLKIYQLQRPILKYDCLLIDEAQDLTPAQLSILMQQTCTKILAGDEHQQIYSFRGTTNALDTFSHSATFDLTQSFRFGPEIAYVASCVLEHLQKERKKTIVGQLVSDGVTGEEEGQVAIIAKQNSTLFDEMVHFCEHHSSKIGFVGGLRSYDLDMILDIYRLIGGKEGIDDPDISKFGNIKELETYASKGGDSRIKGKISICRKYGDWIPILIDMIKEREVNIKYAPVVFSTAHKSKGLEFDTVKLTDDFFHPEYGPSTDDKNLLYVVVTRAKRRLVMSPTLVELLHHVKEDFVYPIRPTEPEPMGASKVKCPLCDETRETAAIQFEKLPDPLILSTRDSVTGKQIRKPGGILCRQCTSKAVPFMNPLPRLKLSNVAGLCDILIGARFDVSRWKSLASQLEISDPGRIEDMYHFPIPCLEEVIHQWLRCDQAPSWGKLATAVNKVESRGQGPTLRHAMKVSQEGISGVIRKSDRPTLTQLTWFPGQRETINIVEKVASYYSDIGTSLLNDRDGSKVAAILQERQNDPIQITTAILRSWLDFYRYTRTWARLVQCLQKAGLNTLAKDIEDVLHEDRWFD